MARASEWTFVADLRCLRGGTWAHTPVALSRPSDGEPPAAVVLRCGHCDRELTYRVFSFRDFRRWRWIWASWSVAGFALVALAFVAAATTTSGVVGLLWNVFVGVPGFMLGGWAVQYRTTFIGVRGPGWLYRYPHHVAAWPR